MRTKRWAIQAMAGTVAICGLHLAAMAEEKYTAGNEAADTVEVQIGERSRVVVEFETLDDLKNLSDYDLNKMIVDLEETLRQQEGARKLVIEDSTGEHYLKDEPLAGADVEEDEEFRQLEEAFDNVEKDIKVERRHEHRQEPKSGKHWLGNRTRFVSGFEFGMNNYLQDGSFPDDSDSPYTVKPWGSWYVALMPTWQTNLAGPLSLDYGAGVSWYNFKMQDPDYIFTKGDDATFARPLDPALQASKSKLTVAYVGAHLVPVLDLGYRSEKKRNHDGTTYRQVHYTNTAFRIGFGGYAFYRIDSYTKLVTRADNKDKTRNHSNFYLNNFRYGARVLVGVGDVDFFVNYDLNELFAENRGPKLNAFSFGLSF